MQAKPEAQALLNTIGNKRNWANSSSAPASSSPTDKEDEVDDNKVLLDESAIFTKTDSSSVHMDETNDSDSE